MMNNLLRRRFVNIISENCKSATCSLHRLDVSEHLFFPSTAEAEAHQAAKTASISSLESLPAPSFSFQPEPRLLRTWQLFALANPRSSESRILWSSPEGGVTVVYDADARCCHAMPSLADMGCQPVTISVARPAAGAGAEEEDLYVLSSNSTYPSFHVLPFGGRRTNKSPWRRGFKEKPPWRWEALPPPPLPRDFGVSSHTVLDDGATICVTATCYTYGDDVEGGYQESALTCLFDTARREWRRSSWDLPFSGGAEYVPELKLWLGLCRDEHRLCAYDLLSAAAAAAAAGEREPPTTTLKHLGGVFEMQMPKEWESIEACLLNLGDGRFCIAKIIQEDWGGDHPFLDGGVTMRALLTGVEMVSGLGGGFRMITHKSLSYIFGNDRILWVL